LVDWHSRINNKGIIIFTKDFICYEIFWIISVLENLTGTTEIIILDLLTEIQELVGGRGT
jgi:hypothetical protein